jgi:hypothetical protein
MKIGRLLRHWSGRAVVLELVQLEHQQGRDPAQYLWAAAGPKWLFGCATLGGCIGGSG